MLEKILTYFQNPEEKALVKAAYDLAWEAHNGQKREGGEPYIQHPLTVALTLVKMNLDVETIAAALLHDVVEDTKYTLDDIEKQFGKIVAFLVNGVTKLNKIKYSGAEGKTENLRKMFLAMAQDIRVVLVKLADRYHNMTTLEALSKEDQKKVALETLEIYAPIAYRLGMGELKGQLEDLAFKHLYPDKYLWLENEVTSKYESRMAYIKKLEPILYEILKKEEIVPIEIHARAKHFYSLYKKLLRNQMNFDKIHDLVAARIILNTIEDCYLTLGLIHQTWKPVPGLIKDYIAMPKPNGYQSLHTSVFGPDGKITEIQIRTPEMHARAENGIAAHWAYKERGNNGSNFQITQNELAWVEQLKEWQKAVRGSDEFFESLKIDFFKDRIFVLTPKGDVLDLPEGATPIDFAYNVHTTVGHECTGAKINGKIAPLDAKLESGDLVEILTQKGKKPSDDWLNITKTNLAKDRIRNALKNKNRKFIKETKKQALTEIKLAVLDRIGLLKDISNAISAKKINIASLNTDVKSKNFPALINVSLNLKDKNKLQNLVLELKKIKGVKEVNYKI
jgi:GTP pyrophosphokinase